MVTSSYKCVFTYMTKISLKAKFTIILGKKRILRNDIGHLAILMTICAVLKCRERKNKDVKSYTLSKCLQTTEFQ